MKQITPIGAGHRSARSEEKNLTSADLALRSDGNGDPEERVIEIHKSGVMSEDGQFAPLVNMMELASHNQCLALSAVLRGKLCDQLTSGKAACRIVPGECIYLIGDRAAASTSYALG